MAITQVTAPLSVPATNADWTNMTYHLKANRLGLNNPPFILTNDDNTSIPAIAIGSYIQFGDSLYIVDTEDYTIQGTPVDGNNYIRIEPSGTTLIATWIQDKSSYSWNPVNNYYEISASDYALLPYLVLKDGTEYAKYSMAMNASFGKVKATTLNTGHGDNELYAMDQNVRTTDSPNFVGITTTNGPNKPVDNNDSSLPTIGIGGFTYGVLPTRTVNASESFTLPTGGTYVYVISASSAAGSTNTRIGNGAGGSTTLEIFGNSGWQTSIIAWRIA